MTTLRPHLPIRFVLRSHRPFHFHKLPRANATCGIWPASVLDVLVELKIYYRLVVLLIVEREHPLRLRLRSFFTFALFRLFQLLFQFVHFCLQYLYSVHVNHWGFDVTILRNLIDFINIRSKRVVSAFLECGGFLDILTLIRSF